MVKLNTKCWISTQPKLSSKQVRWQNTLALFNVDVQKTTWKCKNLQSLPKLNQHLLLLCKLLEEIYKNDLCNQVDPLLFWIFVIQHFGLHIAKFNNNLNTSWISSYRFDLWYICFWTFFYFDILIWFLHIYICSSTFFTIIFKVGFYKSTCSSTCSTLIFKFGFCKTTFGVGDSPFTCSSLIFSFGFYKLSFKPIFCNKSFRLDLSSFTFTSRSIIFNTTSLEAKNFKQSCNCFSTLALWDDILL